MQKVGDIIQKYKLDDTDKYVSREFQKYAYDLSVELNDLKHKSLYMKLAKETPRILLEKARSFVKDAQNARSKGRLFMWKLKQLKTAATDTQEERKRS
ncbi:MAG: hypothetical protein UU12_C0029G0021 [Candidatus Woesebacteria bacterium GW2011_GWA2_40_7b]|uniref:Uncharacterized protein n=1 Tax=Candidatus Woesebacteria bacterium GW2011_GWA2_40_7b TaxID=1618563 RepID=A0A0G0VDM0_9BACT|nr:MAG: hypothetical protein UU12_C0029G0021 [Candidatus Woesebacteria bacterium GW2011_GWA2_40_7b]